MKEKKQSNQSIWDKLYVLYVVIGACFVLYVIGTIIYWIVSFFSWLSDAGSEFDEKCDVICQAEVDKCISAHVFLAEANDFDRERLLISKQEHSRRKMAIYNNWDACENRARAESDNRKVSGE